MPGARYGVEDVNVEPLHFVFVEYEMYSYGGRGHKFCRFHKRGLLASPSV